MPRTLHSAHESEPEDEARAEDWALRLRRGRPDAVRKVRARIAKIISYRALRIAPGDRTDLEQEIMIEVWQAVNRTGFDLTAGFWGFVETVTARRCIDWLRSRKNEAPSPLFEDMTSPAMGPLERSLERERAALAAEVWGQLESGCQELITLRVRQGLSFREMSPILRKSEGALRVQLYRCIRRAQRVLERTAESRSADGKAGSS